MAVLLRDLNLPDTAPLSRLRTIFSTRNGILTGIERARILFKNHIYFHHPDPVYAALVAEIDGVELAERVSEEAFDLELDSEDYSPVRMISRIADCIAADLELLKGGDFPFINGAHQRDAVNGMLNGSVQIGRPENFLIHPGATILPGSVFDTNEGPVVIDEGARISPFTYIEGPAYIGKNARVDNARITGGCVIGHQVRAGGEIENSILNDYTNKHHEGFLGHSVTGSWVNLGALSTTSDLKNNYGEIRLDLPPSLVPDGRTAPFETGTIKFGSIIGDCVKVAIGTMLNTGSVIDVGSNIFGGCARKYVPPLSWGPDGRYDPEKFLTDQIRIFRRRGMRPHDNISRLIELFTSDLR